MPAPLRRACRLVFVLAILSGRHAEAADGANLIRNGDFEQPAGPGVPPGWTMWGADRDKVVANFQRDQERPHAGVACLRIRHPAGTAGYIVTAPELAVRPRAGMRYVVSFWARADRPGQARFGWTAYRDVKPFVDAPAPGHANLAVDTDWREFRFTADEGWEFFADEARYLMLTFHAAGDRGEERTLWVDDVVVTEEPSPRPGRLVNPATLEYAPLDHRLRSGTDRLELTVDASRVLREASREVGGVSFHRVAGWARLPYNREGKYVLPEGLEDAVRQLRMPMTRFYALGDEPFGLDGAIDRAAELVRRVGVPAGATPLEFEIQGATSRLSPEAWARGVRHSVERNYGFRWWEVGNEPYVRHAGAAFRTAEDYLEHFLKVSRAIRAVQPDARIGLSIEPASPAWGNGLLKRAAGHYDFVVGHYYCFADVNRSSFEDVVLGGNERTIDLIQRTNALVRLYNPGRDVVQYDTEWGMHGSGPNGERADDVRRNANIVGTMHRAVRLVHYLREGMLAGASTWEMFTYRNSPGFSVLASDAPELRSMIYWLYYHFNRHVGRRVVELDGTAPFVDGQVQGRPWRAPIVAPVATLDEDGRRLYLILANGSWERPIPCSVTLRHFAAARVESVVLSHPDRDGEPLLERRSDFVHDLATTLTGDRLQTTLPPHSVAFLTLTLNTPPAPPAKPVDPKVADAAGWLRAKAAAMIRASRVPMADGTAAFPPQAGAGYDAFWLRDFAYQLEGCRDVYTDRELTDACRTFVRAIGPEGAGVDCVKFYGTPVYKPGFGTMGEHAVADGSPFTVAVAWHAFQKTRDARLLDEVIDPLVRTMRAVPRDPKTGLVFIRPGGWERCPYGFTDTVRKQGAELFTSLLYIQACRRLADLLAAAQRPDEAGHWRDYATRLAPVLRETFWDERIGLFRAATVACTQPDIWGSAFAVDLGVATPDQARTIAGYFKTHYDAIGQRGQIRHLPGGVYWDSACPRDIYQNGGFWATATGWFIETLDLVDPELADRTFVDLVDDFRARGVSEWVLGPRTAVMNYLASATMPLAGIRTVCDRRGQKLP